MKQRIILVMPDPPLPFGGAAARWFYVLLKGLVERGHSVTAFAVFSEEQERQAALRMFPASEFDLRLYAIPREVTLHGKWNSFWRPQSSQFSAELRRDLKEELERGYDVLHLEQLCSGFVGLEHASRALLNVHHSYAIDHGAAPPSTLHQAVLRGRLRRVERQVLRNFRYVRVLTPRLADWVRKCAPGADVHTVPLGMDFDLYPFRTRDRAQGGPVLGLVGSFNWTPSQSAGERLLRRLWPAIKARVPSARLQIVGRAAVRAFEGTPSAPDVTFHQDVENVLPYFDGMDALLYAPAIGSGMKVKVLESLALGVPVIVNGEGAEGLGLIDGVHAGVCDEDEGLIDRAVHVLTDADARRRMAVAGRELVERTCGPANTLAGLQTIYAHMSNHPAARTQDLRRLAESD